MATDRGVVSDALVQRARAALRTADEERRRLESLTTRLRAAEGIYAKLGAIDAVASRKVRVIVGDNSRDEGVVLPEHLTVRALAAIAEVVSAEVAEIAAELEGPRG